MYIDRTIKDYLDDLAARKPAPGGGSAAALGAALGAALMSMVANYTVGNSKYKEHEKEIADILVRAENARRILQGLVDEDVAAYEKLSKAMKEKGISDASLDEAYKDATNPPLEICKVASECLKLCKALAEYGNKNLITDTAIAAIMFEAAFFSAKFNVCVNLKYIKDTAYSREIRKTVSSFESGMSRMEKEIAEKCERVLAK